VNEITAIDPYSATPQFSLDWGEGASKSGNLHILPDRTDPTNKADRYWYDYRNRLIKVEHTDNYGDATPTWSTVVQYYYDGLNRRVKKDLASGTDVIYLYDGWQVLEEREWDSTGSKWEPRRQYVEGGTYIDEHLLFDKDTDDDGDCTDTGGSSRYFYAQQANWNVVAVTDASGDVVERIHYDPYGQPTVTVQPGKTASGNPYLFQGRRCDDEVDLYYFRNRMMSPVLGRFLQRDPFGYLEDMTLYECFGGSPEVWKDEQGWARELIPGCGKLQPLFYDYYSPSCKHNLPCSRNVTNALRIARNLAGRYAFGVLCYRGFDHRHRQQLSQHRTQLRKCAKAIRETCFPRDGKPCPSGRPQPAPAREALRSPEMMRQPPAVLEPPPGFFRRVGRAALRGARAFGRATVQGARIAARGIAHAGEFAWEHPAESLMVAVGAGVVVFDVATVPSGEGAAGVYLIRYGISAGAVAPAP